MSCAGCFQKGGAIYLLKKASLDQDTLDNYCADFKLCKKGGGTSIIEFPRAQSRFTLGHGQKLVYSLWVTFVSTFDSVFFFFIMVSFWIACFIVEVLQWFYSFLSGCRAWESAGCTLQGGDREERLA